MITLAVDTATELLSAAVLLREGAHGTQGASICLRAGKHRGSQLLILIDALLKAASLAIGDIELFVCGRGPGSFTGLRIGMATIKGLSAGSDRPFVVIPTLDALAWRCRRSSSLLLPLIDARRNRWYTALYHRERKLTDDLDIEEERLSALCVEWGAAEKGIVCIGPDADHFVSRRLDRLGAAPEDETRIVVDSDETGCALALAELGRRVFRAQGSDEETVGPDYVRLSQAEETGRPV